MELGALLSGYPELHAFVKGGLYRGGLDIGDRMRTLAHLNGKEMRREMVRKVLDRADVYPDAVAISQTKLGTHAENIVLLYEAESRERVADCLPTPIRQFFEATRIYTKWRVDDESDRQQTYPQYCQYELEHALVDAHLSHRYIDNSGHTCAQILDLAIKSFCDSLHEILLHNAARRLDFVEPMWDDVVRETGRSWLPTLGAYTRLSDFDKWVPMAFFNVGGELQSARDLAVKFPLSNFSTESYMMPYLAGSNGTHKIKFNFNTRVSPEKSALFFDGLRALPRSQQNGDVWTDTMGRPMLSFRFETVLDHCAKMG